MMHGVRVRRPPLIFLNFFSKRAGLRPFEIKQLAAGFKMTFRSRAGLRAREGQAVSALSLSEIKSEHSDDLGHLLAPYDWPDALRMTGAPSFRLNRT